MKAKNLLITAIYEGVKPVDHEELGKRKYIGYDHLFSNVESVTGLYLSYSQSRAKKIPEGLVVGKRYVFKCVFKSSILTKITH